LLRSRVAAHDSAATANIRSMITAEVAYFTAYPSTGFDVTSLSHLGPAATPPCDGKAACLLDGNLACTIAPCRESGFTYFLNNGAGRTRTIFPAPAGAQPNLNFLVSTTPISMGSSGDRNVCAFEDGVVRSTNNAVPALTAYPPTLASPGETFVNCNDFTKYGPAND
jgi:hypothetical protein